MKIRHIPLRADEFLAAVAGEMSPAELGVYWMICLLQYSRGGSLKKDPEWLRAKFRPGKSNRVVGDILETLITSGRVYCEEGEIGVRRCREELQTALSRVREASESGRRGGRPKRKINEIEKGHPFSGEKLTHKHINTEEKDILTDVQKEDAGKRERWAADRELPMEWIAETYGRYPTKDGYSEAEKFCAYWSRGKGAKTARVDWRRTWLNWMDKAREGRDSGWIDRYGYRKLLHGPRSSPEEEAQIEQFLWRTRVNRWRESRGWHDSFGPEPGKPGCRVPPELLVEEAA